ncbi:hypothetical protein BGX28_001708 [Mortierella sp. GBA30]|nr:hypothetical protein BGX28_001708 [Mortierella sp. GBA30]
MNFLYVFTIIVAASSIASAYVCPSSQDINNACKQLNVFPLVCHDPKVFVDLCNQKQCSQNYIDNYAACQCRRNMSDFYEASSFHFYGNFLGYYYLRSSSDSPFPLIPVPVPPNTGNNTTRIYNGTTYYGGQIEMVSGTTLIVNATVVVNGTATVSGTTTWFSGTPGIINGTSSSAPWNTPTTRFITATFTGTTETMTSVTGGGGSSKLGSRTVQPILAPSSSDAPIAINNQSSYISGGAIAGIVLGLLGASILATLLALCWRKKRAEHVAPVGRTHISHAPTRTVVTEKIEPVILKKGQEDQVAHGDSVPGAVGDNPADHSGHMANSHGYNP